MIELTGIPEINTDRLRLRGPKPSDFGAMADFLASPRAQYIGGPVSRVLAWRSFGHLVGHWLLRGYSMFILADKTSDAALGMAGPWFPEGWPEPELGWSIWSADAEGKGLAQEAALAARRYAYGPLGWQTAISLIAENNLRSQALAQRLGCTRDGSFTHETFGASQIWRHPSPESLA